MNQPTIRRPAFAGKFYSADKKELSKLIAQIHQKEQSRINLSYKQNEIYGAVVPHAGYMFSAYQAIHFFDLIKNIDKRVDTFVIVNPNHTGFGESISLDSHDLWRTPYGNVAQDKDFIENLGLPISDIAHQDEHSGEIMLPLLQYFIEYNFKVVMITLSQQNYENAKDLAIKIKNVAQKLNRDIMLIASSDFTHFKNAEIGKKKDDLVLERIKNQDIEGIEDEVHLNEISVCGYGPIMCLMEYASLFGAYKSSILARGHSGQIIPSDKVVDYISILFYKS